MSKKSKAAPGGKVSVKLLTHHTHASEEMEPGDVIEVSVDVAQAMVGWGVGEVLPVAAGAQQRDQAEGKDAGANA
jgi:hypothetical protein